MNNVLTATKAILTTTVPRWQTLVDSVPPELLARTPVTGEWSALGCLVHLIDVEQVFQFRLAALMEGRDFPAFNPDAEGSPADGAESPAALVAAFARLRDASLVQLARVTEADLDRRAVHAELGEVSLQEMIHEWGAHDLDHTIQAERALMQPFIRGCGPWQRFFTANDMGGE